MQKESLIKPEIQAEMRKSIEVAQQELAYAIYMSECAKTMRKEKAASAKALWLSWLIYLAKRGLEVELEESK